MNNNNNQQSFNNMKTKIEFNKIKNQCKFDFNTKKHYIKGLFTKAEVQVINKALENFQHSGYDLDDGYNDPDEIKEYKKYNAMCELAGILVKRNITVTEVTKGSKQELDAELKLYKDKFQETARNNYYLKQENKQQKETIEKLQKELNILKLPSVPNKEQKELEKIKEILSDADGHIPLNAKKWNKIDAILSHY